VFIVTRRHMSEAMEHYPDAANEIKAWVGIVERARWHNFDELRTMPRRRKKCTPKDMFTSDLS